MFRLKEECSSINIILDQVKYRSEWIKYQEAQRRKEEEELEKERGRYVRVHVLLILKRFAKYNQQDATFHSLFISVRRSVCFRRFFRPSSGAQNCTYSVRYFSDQYLMLCVQF